MKSYAAPAPELDAALIESAAAMAAAEQRMVEQFHAAGRSEQDVLDLLAMFRKTRNHFLN